MFVEDGSCEENGETLKRQDGSSCVHVMSSRIHSLDCKCCLKMSSRHLLHWIYPSAHLPFCVLCPSTHPVCTRR